MNSVTPAFLAEAVKSDQRMVQQVQVWSEPTLSSSGILLQDISQKLTSGSCTEDESQQVRRTCQLTLVSTGTDGLVPTKQGDLLHPASNNELRLFRGFQYSDGTTEVAPCGVYRMSKPVVTDAADGITIQLNGMDRSARVTRAAWVNPYVITDGTPIDQAVQAALENRFPGLTYNLVSSSFLLPGISFGTQVGTGQNDPWADIAGLATSGGYELFFDANGIVVMRTVPDPTTHPVVLDYGLAGVVTQFARTMDETQTYNGVVAISTASGLTAPIQEAVFVTDPNSPVYPPRYGQFPSFYTSPLITSQAQAIAAATAKLQLLLTALDESSFQAVPNAALTAGDIVSLTDARIGTNAAYAASSIVMPSDPGSLMQVTCRARRTAA